tara:strand:- start:239 stop:448 length:210 start_codon:yes stop_codon:yes gene_type:complete
MKDLKWMRDDNKSKFYPYCVECGKNNDRKRKAACSDCSEAVKLEKDKKASEKNKTILDGFFGSFFDSIR